MDASRGETAPRHGGRRAALLLAATVLLACASASGDGAKAEDRQAQSDFRTWYERAIAYGTDAADALAANAPLQISKWDAPLKIRLYLDDEHLAHEPEFESYLGLYLDIISDTTDLSAEVLRVASPEAPNILVYAARSIDDAVQWHQDEITAFMSDHGETAGNLLANPASRAADCWYVIQLKSAGQSALSDSRMARMRVAKALLFVPASKDVTRTEKCLGGVLFQVLGMFGANFGSASVINKTDTAILPTVEDQRALRIQYLAGMESGVTPARVMAIVKQARSRGLLK